MKRIIMMASIAALTATLFSGCDNVLAQEPKRVKHTEIKATEFHAFLVIDTNTRLTMRYACLDGLEQHVIGRLDRISLSPHWIQLPSGEQRIKECNY